MIDLQKAKQVFQEYIQTYDLKNEMITLKVAHMYRVAEISREIAKDLILAEEDIRLAELIGLLHDLGRFEQIRKYGTFQDSISINHAEQGVRVLFQEGWIRKFIEDSQYDEIIRKAIVNHNKAQIEGELSERERLHAKIIRDADKTDIFYVTLTDKMENVYECTEEEMAISEITDEIMEEYKREGKIDYEKRKHCADGIIARLAFVFDFHFHYGLRVVYENHYLEKIITKTEFRKEETKERVNLAYEMAQQYMEEKLGVNHGEKYIDYGKTIGCDGFCKSIKNE